MNFDSSISARGSQKIINTSSYNYSYMYVATIGTGSSLLVLHKDFLTAELRTFDDKLKVVELAGANKRRF